MLDLDAGDDEALSALDGLYARTGRAEPRRRLLERRAELALAAGRSDAVALAVDAAATAAADGDATAAARLYERVLTVEPLHDAAGAFLEGHHRERADWPALVSLYRLRARHRAGAERAELYAQVSGIEEHELGNRRAAFASLLEALEADGRFAVHGEDLRRLAGAVDGWPMLCATLQRRAAAAGQAERSEAYLDLGGALEEAKQHAAAIEAYRALLAVEPTNLTALERLQGLYRLGGQSAQLDVLARRAELTTDRDDQLALYRALAAEAGRMERWGRAVEAHRRWPSSIRAASGAASSSTAPASSTAISWRSSTRRSVASSRRPTSIPPTGSSRRASWPRRWRGSSVVRRARRSVLDV